MLRLIFKRRTPVTPVAVLTPCPALTAPSCERDLFARILNGEPVWTGDLDTVTPAHAAHVRTALGVASYATHGDANLAMVLTLPART